MGCLQMLVTVSALSGVGETVLIDFSADWCGPCRAMSPVVDRLAAEGFPVRKVNIDQQRSAAQQYRVSGIPCFVMLVDGEEVDRVVGATSYQRLRQMLQRGKVRPPGQGATTSRGQSPEGRRAIIAPARAGGEGRPAKIRMVPSLGSGSGPSRRAMHGDAPVSADSVDSSNATVAKRLLAATVRLRITEADGQSYASGTIVDSRQGEALVLTCGHAFRESGGKGKLVVEQFDAGRVRQYAGHLIRYDDRRDVGLVSFRPEGEVASVRIAPPGHQVARGDRMISVGCDHGRQPSVREGQVLALNSFVGPANVKVSGQPVQGRSGGGLFTADGLLVGVCNFADPTDKAGAYAALSVIQQHLDSAQLAHVYADPPPQPAGATVRPAADAKTASIATNISSKERNQPPAETGGGTLPAAGTVEVICIVRSKQRPQTDSEVIVLDDVSPEFLRRLADERRTQSRRHQTSLEVQQRRWERRVAGNGASGDPSSGWRPNWRKPRLELTER